MKLLSSDAVAEPGAELNELATVLVPFACICLCALSYKGYVPLNIVFTSLIFVGACVFAFISALPATAKLVIGFSGVSMLLGTYWMTSRMPSRSIACIALVTIPLIAVILALRAESCARLRVLLACIYLTSLYWL